VGEVASSNLVVPTIYFQLVKGGKCPKWVHGFEPGLVDLGCADSLVRRARPRRLTTAHHIKLSPHRLSLSLVCQQ